MDDHDKQSHVLFPIPPSSRGSSPVRQRSGLHRPNKLSTVLRAASYGKGKQAERASSALSREDAHSIPRAGSSTGILAGFVPGQPHGRPSSLTRRVSHPVPSRSLLQQDCGDGEFIKRAFESLSVGEPPTSKQRPSYMGPKGSAGPEHQVSLIDMLSNDDPLGVGVTFRRAMQQHNASRSSLASSLGRPPSTISHFERNSVTSSRSLLVMGGESSSGSGSGGKGTFDRITNWPPGGSGNGGTQSRRESHTWSDPFDETKSFRLRRRSTISGYSVSSADWMSLRRGSLVSIENASVKSKRGSIAPGGPADPFADAAAGSTRWEAWAHAYKESFMPLSNVSLQVRAFMPLPNISCRLMRRLHTG